MAIQSWEQRVAQKQAARDDDAEAIRSGRKTVEQLNAENGAIAYALADSGVLDLDHALAIDWDDEDLLDF